MSVLGSLCHGCLNPFLQMITSSSSSSCSLPVHVTGIFHLHCLCHEATILLCVNVSISLQQDAWVQSPVNPFVLFSLFPSHSKQGFTLILLAILHFFLQNFCQCCLLQGNQHPHRPFGAHGGSDRKDQAAWDAPLNIALICLGCCCCGYFL